MLPYIVAFLGLASASVLSVNIEPVQRCNEQEPSVEYLEFAGQLRSGNYTVTESQDNELIQVDTYFHVLANSSSEADGYLSNKAVEAQMTALNEHWKASGFQFNLINTTWTINEKWSMDTDQLAMKKTLRRGDYKALNLYFLTKMKALGYCYLPGHVTEGSDAFYRDGCTNLAATVPGGGAGKGRFEEGKTATHEVGHWLGLLHTFQGGCSGDGDEVDDTPLQGKATSGCPKDKDTCPDHPGKDPVHNYMDYSDDPCLTEFTPGQAKRAKAMWDKFRAK